MPGALPVADPAPADGLLPTSSATGADRRDFGVYLHVPFCRVRCGYCDFNTYTAQELRGVSRADFVGQAAAEVSFAGRVLRRSGLPERPVSTVFFGGGTPTVLAAAELTGLLAAVATEWRLAEKAEVTCEANPDSVTEQYLLELAAGGITRISFGMQSAVPAVLATLERTHDPARLPQVVTWARQAGLQVSVDLIYGTPGESQADWRRSLEAAIALQPDHISAYALIVEPGTRLARQIGSGRLPGPDEDLQADMYELADGMLTAAGYAWYEVSNWERRRAGRRTRSLHNLAYWLGSDWWGIGPGAHSHVGGVRWWNAKHPAAYAQRILAGSSPAVGRETLSPETRELERMLLLSRVREALPLNTLPADAAAAIPGLLADGLLEVDSARRGRLSLTLTGRLLADTVVRRLT